MCGPASAIGLVDSERRHWPWLRERLRVSGQCMGLMRGVLGDEAEVAAVIATDRAGISHPIALLVTAEIRDEIRLPAHATAVDGLVEATIADDPITVLVRTDRPSDPVAILISPWIRQHLSLYARQLWWPRRAAAAPSRG